MEYKGLNYSLAPTTNPPGWRWVVFLNGINSVTGVSSTRAHAVLDAEHAINEASTRVDQDGNDREADA